MYPTIGDFLNDLFGTNILLPFPTFGFFVAMAFVTAAYFLGKEIERYQAEGKIPTLYKEELVGKAATAWQLFSSGFIGFILGHKLLGVVTNYGHFGENPQEYLLSGQGNPLGGIILGAYFVYAKYSEKKKQQLDTPKIVKSELTAQELVSNITVIAAVSGLIGAKVFHNIEYPEQFLADPIGVILSTSGLTFYGGLLVGMICVLYYLSKRNVNWKVFMDSVSPIMMLAYGVGRIGCQVAGDGDWGIPNDSPKPDWLSWAPDWMWAYNYPNNVLGVDLKADFARDGFVSLTGYAFPTPFYETLMAIAIFAFLWFIRKKITTPGVMFGTYLIFNGAERFLIEKIRVNTTLNYFSIELTQAELISSILVLTGIGLIFFFKKTHKSEPLEV
jgi:prolipoprotein diacylglyceryltransferase